jgi:enoyl-CoA hydratase/carnithine racemase
MIAKLTAAFETDDTTDIRAIVLTSAGSETFSAGYDATHFTKDTDDRAHEQQFETLIETVRNSNPPTVAKLQGDVYGAAVELVATCDVRLAATDAHLCVPTAKLGLVYPVRAIETLLDLAGPANVTELLYTGEPIGASRAQQMGFLNRVVDSERLDEVTESFVSTLTKNAPLSLAGTKAIVHQLRKRESLSAAEIKRLQQIRMQAYESDDFQEGLTAFEENREPDFKGE